MRKVIAMLAIATALVSVMSGTVLAAAGSGIRPNAASFSLMGGGSGIRPDGLVSSMAAGSGIRPD